MRGIRKYAGQFVLVIGLGALGLATGLYILVNQDARPTLPLFEDKPISYVVELANAQAVVPGQGQSVRVAGVQVGKISDVSLENGLALVEIAVDGNRPGLVREDASALLRPRTSLKDMFIELDPGSLEAPAMPAGGRITVENTAEDIDPDEVLATLDGDTRAYLVALVNGAGGGLRNRGDEVRAIFAQFEPLHRSVAKVNGAFAARRQALARLVDRYGELTRALGRNESDLTRLVDASEGALGAIAPQNQRISQAIAGLPAALRQTETTLGSVRGLADELGPAATALRPAFRQLDSANEAIVPFAREATPDLRDRIRPFVRQSTPYVDDLVKPAARDLRGALPELDTTFLELNRFLNILAFNPRDYAEGFKRRPETGAEPVTGAIDRDTNRAEGYLYWAHWASAAGNSVFGTRDAQGLFRRFLPQVDCDSFQGFSDHYADELRDSLPEPLRPLAGEFSTAALTLIFGGDVGEHCP